MDIPSSFRQLRDMVEEKRIHLQQIYELTVKQSEALNSSQLKIFVDLISSKQKIIEKINSIDERFERVYDVFRQSSNNGTFNEVYIKQKDLLEIQNTIKIIQHLVEQIRNAESQNDFLYKSIISKMMNSVSQDISDRQEKISRYKKMNNYNKKFTK